MNKKHLISGRVIFWICYCQAAHPAAPASQVPQAWLVALPRPGPAGPHLPAFSLVNMPPPTIAHAIAHAIPLPSHPSYHCYKPLSSLCEALIIFLCCSSFLFMLPADVVLFVMFELSFEELVLMR